MKPRILVVDDEPEAVELIEFNLRGAGCEVIAALNGSEALQKARSMVPDLIVLDLMMPGIDGMEVCTLLRREAATASIPIVMLTARSGEVDRVLGLELGADDYITKPFSPRELVLRIKNLIARRQPAPSKRERLVCGNLVIDIPRHSVTWREKPIKLTITEFRLLALLVERSDCVQSRDRLLREVWHYEAVIDTRTVDTHVRRLRKKLGPAADHLATVRGVGYRFVE